MREASRQAISLRSSIIVLTSSIAAKKPHQSCVEKPCRRRCTTLCNATLASRRLAAMM
ncbi:Hypothetical predicted protein, partial [Olea europaea subsp. europaea]